MAQGFGHLPLLAGAGASLAAFGQEADGVATHPLLDHVLQADEGAAADEQDLAGVHLDAVLVGMLATPLGRHVGHGALQHLQQGLLHPLAGDIAGD